MDQLCIAVGRLVGTPQRGADDADRAHEPAQDRPNGAGPVDETERADH